jgi:signal transduction histidine kinase
MVHQSSHRQYELDRLEETNLRLVGEARLLLALVAASVVLFAPPRVPTLLPLLGILVGYAAYSAVLMLQASSGQPSRGLKNIHWIDAGCYVVAVGLSGGLASPLSVFVLFPVLVASLQAGFRRGAAVALASTAALASIGLVSAWLDADGSFRVSSFWPVATLLLMGLAIARWGSSEFTLMRRLACVNDLNHLANPRQDFKHAMAKLAEMLRMYHRADSCVVVMFDSASAGYLLCEARCESKEGVRGERISQELAEPLLSVSPELGLVYGRRRYFWHRTIAVAYDRTSLEPRPIDQSRLEEIANLLDGHAFLSLPIYCRERLIGRLFATSRRARYRRVDLRFLQQAIGHASLAIDTIRLLDQLASETATQERHKISRDLHDGTIQPYIGLKLGLEALRRQVPEATPLAAEVDDLARMATEGIAELRQYIAGLREQAAKRSGDSLLVAVRQQAEKFSEFYGIKVDVVADGDMQLNESLFREVMNIVREGLANIRRHTAANRATVRLREGEGRLVMEFLNEHGSERRRPPLFFPRSLNERASNLGGRVDVVHREDDHTLVAVEIPV